MPEKDVTHLAQRVELLLMDVDGVLTDGKLIFVPMSDGTVTEAKAFDAGDGAAIGFARRAGLKTGILSGRSSPAVDRRAEELHIDFVYQGLGRNKRPALAEIIERSKLALEQVCYVGDDVQDIPLLMRVGFPVCVPGSRPEVIAHAAYVTSSSGGSGALRELVELILKAQGKWEPAIAEFFL